MHRLLKCVKALDLPSRTQTEFSLAIEAMALAGTEGEQWEGEADEMLDDLEHHLCIPNGDTGEGEG